MDLFFEAKTKFNKITECKYFNEAYVIILALIALFGWGVNTIAAMSIFIVIATIMLILTNDFKFIIPCAIYSLFSINKGFNNNEVPIPIIVSGVLLLLVMIVEVVKNKISLKRMKGSLGLIGLAVFNLIPIFWANIPKDYSIFYIFFLGNLIYLLVYALFVNGLKSNAFNLLAHTMTYLGLLIAVECMAKVIELSGTVDNVLKLTYHLGWGVCNEAAIMICVAMPFTFYLLGNSENIKYMIINHLKVVLMLIGVLLTTSRGGLIFSTIEANLLFISLFFVSRNRRLYTKVTSIYLGTVIIISLICIMPLRKLIDDIMKYIFTNGLESNGRISLWKEAFYLWIDNPRNIILGPGMTAVIRDTSTGAGVQQGIIVFHSTLMETLAMGGLLGFIALAIHFIEKYYSIYKTKDKLLFTTMLIGFLVVDIYGMIDNTYHMYYFMVPLVIIMAVLSNMNYDKELNTI